MITQKPSSAGRRIFVRTDDWDESDEMMHKLLRKMPQWGMMTSSHAILLQVDYERPSRTRIIKEPLGEDQPNGTRTTTNMQGIRPQLERVRRQRLRRATANGLLPAERVQG